MRRVGHDLSYFCAIILPVSWDRASRRGRLRMGLRLWNHEEGPGGLWKRAEPGMVVEGWRGGGISQGEVRTGAGEGGLVFLEVEKSRPIIPAKKSREKMGHPGKGWVQRKLGRHWENQPGAKH